MRDSRALGVSHGTTKIAADLQTHKPRREAAQALQRRGAQQLPRHLPWQLQNQPCRHHDNLQEMQYVHRYNASKVHVALSRQQPEPQQQTQRQRCQLTHDKHMHLHETERRLH